MDRYGYEEDLDQYEDDFIEDDEEQKEAPRHSKEVLDYLELRQRLKEQRRKELKKENGTINDSSRDKKSLGSRDNFGSFFGPSEPVIAQRVIQESKALLETVSSSSRVNKSSQNERKSAGPSLSGAKSQSSGQKPIARNGTMPSKKLEIIKNTRDYSFLLNDDAELPVPKKVPPPRNISAPRPPEARSSRPSDRSVSNRSSTPSSDRLLPRVGAQRPNPPRPSMDSRKQLNGRPSVDARKHINGRSDERSLRHESASNGVSADRRKQLSGSGPGRPLLQTRAPPSRPSSSVIVARPSSSKPNPTVSRQPNPTVSRQPNPPVSRQSNPPVSRQQPKQSATVSRQPNPPVSRQLNPPVSRQQPKQAGNPKQSIRAPPPQSRSHRDERKRPRVHDDDEGDEALRELRKLTGYNPNKFRDEYDSDSDMEAGFNEIQQEEQRSARFGKKEDEEELQKELEERRRKLAKKRRLNH